MIVTNPVLLLANLTGDFTPVCAMCQRVAASSDVTTWFQVIGKHSSAILCSTHCLVQFIIADTNASIGRPAEYIPSRSIYVEGELFARRTQDVCYIQHLMMLAIFIHGPMSPRQCDKLAAKLGMKRTHASMMFFHDKQHNNQLFKRVTGKRPHDTTYDITDYGRKLATDVYHSLFKREE